MINRRNVLKFLGGGLVGTLLTPLPWKLLYDAAYWTQNWPWIPRLKYGENAYIPTVSKLDPSGVGMLVRTVAGTPVRTLPNPDNILSQGGITALAATEAQLAVAPSRVKKPLQRSADNAYVPISWEEAMQILNDKVTNAGSSIAAVSSDNTGSLMDVFSSLMNRLNSSDFYLMPSEEQIAQQAWEKMGGKGRIGYNIEEADFIFAIGANYLENWGTVVYNRKDYAKKRPTNGEKMLHLAYAGPAQTNTAACADYYLPCAMNSELIIALGIAHLIIRNGAASFFVGYSDFAGLTADYTPEYVESLTGVPAQKLIDAVTALTEAKNPLVIVGGETCGSVGVLPIMAGIACNLLLKRAFGNNAGLVVDLPVARAIFETSTQYLDLLKRDFIGFAQSVADGSKEAPKLMIFHESNPVYSLPKNAMISELIDKSEYVVSLASFMDETSSKADLVLPLAMDFERFDDVYTPYGSGFVNYAVGQPAVEPPYEARAAADILFAVAQNAGIEFPVSNSAELVTAKAQHMNLDVDDLLDGKSFISNNNVDSLSSFYFNAEMIKNGITQPTEGYAVCIQKVIGFGTPTTGIPPFSTKLITNDQLVGTTMVAQMNAATANKLGLREGQTVQLSNDYGMVTAEIALYEGVLLDTILLPYGLGHTAFDAFSQNKGDNVINLTGVMREAATNAAVFSPMYVNVQKI